MSLKRGTKTRTGTAVGDPREMKIFGITLVEHEFLYKIYLRTLLGKR
jgi:hypothetical protein